MSNPLPTSQISSFVPTPLFVVGCDRSGTTLLTSIIESRLGLAAPLETHFIPYFAKTLFLWGNLAQRRNRATLLTAIYHFLEILVHQNYPNKDRNTLLPATLLATRPHAQTILDQSSNFGELIGQLFGHFASIQGKRGWVDNSSFYESIPLKIWQKHLPDMKVIHMVRDGRDVALSWLQSWWGPASLGEAAQLWSAHVTDKRRWGAAHPDGYLEVQYETLLNDPDQVLQQIAHFLGLQLEPRNLDWSNSQTARILSTGGTHDLLAGPILATNKEKWRRSMSSVDQMLFEYAVSTTLRSSGYPLLHHPPGPMQRVTLWFRLHGSSLRRFFSHIYYAKKAKWLVALFLWMVGPFGKNIIQLLYNQKQEL
ncbi:MAG: sulfotransferase [Magnetococcus sp. YQC-5]